MRIKSFSTLKQAMQVLRQFKFKELIPVFADGKKISRQSQKTEAVSTPQELWKYWGLSRNSLLPQSMAMSGQSQSFPFPDWLGKPSPEVQEQLDKTDEIIQGMNERADHFEELIQEAKQAAFENEGRIEQIHSWERRGSESSD